MKKNYLEISVDEFTSPCPVVVSPEDRAIEAAYLMETNGIRHVPVAIDGRPVGILSDRDMSLLKGTSGGLEIKIRDIMVPFPYCVVAGTPLEEVAYEMSNRKIGSAIVVNSAGILEGIFTSTDGLNALIEILRGEYQARQTYEKSNEL